MGCLPVAEAYFFCCFQVKLEHGNVTFESTGRKKGGGRIRRRPMSFGPPERADRSDKVPENIVTDVHECIETHCPTSPCAKHRVSRVRGRCQRELAHMLCRFVTWETLWGFFKLEYLSSAAKITSETFRNLAPWNLRKGGPESCLCQPCENAEGYGAAARKISRILEPLLETVDEDAPDDEQPEPPHPCLKHLVKVLEQPRKYGVCLCLTFNLRRL